jgi:hypothetical protein
MAGLLNPCDSTRAHNVAMALRSTGISLIRAYDCRIFVDSLQEKAARDPCSPTERNSMHPALSISVITHKTVLMQQIQNYARVGYHFYHTGVVSPKAALSWARKADRYYAVSLDRNRRARAKRLGEGCAILLLHEIENCGKLWWILMVTPPSRSHPAHQLEPLKNAFDSRSRIQITGYELCHLTKKGVAGIPVLSWRMTADAYEARREAIIDTVRRGSPLEMRRLIVSLWRSPGFFGIRQQVGHCVQLLRAEFRRRRPSQAMPRMPNRLLYLSRLAVVAVPLSTWVANQSVRVRDAMWEGSA